MLYFGADTKNQRTNDSKNVINYIYDNFEYVNIKKYVNETFEKYKNYYISNVNLYKTTTEPEIVLEELDNYEFPLKTNSGNSLKNKFYSINRLSSKIKKGSKIGELKVLSESNELCSIDVKLENELKQNSWKYYFIEILKLNF